MYLNDIYYCSQLYKIIKSDLNINDELKKNPIPFSDTVYSFNMPIYDFFTDGIKSFEFYIFINNNYKNRAYIIFNSTYENHSYHSKN